MKKNLFKKRINKLHKTGDWAGFFNDVLEDQKIERENKNDKKNN